MLLSQLKIANVIKPKLTVFGNLYGLINMTLFLILANYIGALVAVQLLRGDLPGAVNMNFKEVYNSFLAMYQASCTTSICKTWCTYASHC